MSKESAQVCKQGALTSCWRGGQVIMLKETKKARSTHNLSSTGGINQDTERRKESTWGVLTPYWVWRDRSRSQKKVGEGHSHPVKHRDRSECWKKERYGYWQAIKGRGRCKSKYQDHKGVSCTHILSSTSDKSGYQKQEESEVHSQSVKGTEKATSEHSKKV